MINHLKISKEFPSVTGNVWVSMGGFTDPGQTPEQLFEEILLKINESMMATGKTFNINYQAGELPVIQIADDEARENILKNIKK